MKDFSNKYIFTFSSIMVIIVALLLSIAASQLKPLQEKNIEIEKMQNILAAVNINSTPQNAQELFKKHITDSYVVDVNGNKIDGIKAFPIELKKEIIKPSEKRNLPVFISIAENGDNIYIVPLRGKGLWGPIWGYIAFKKDMNTIYGAFFDHQGETPGLGAEIKEKWFQEKFTNKQIFTPEKAFISIEVVKGGAAPDNKHQVDAISGGTITSKGLEDMIKFSLADYKNFLLNNIQ